MVRDHLFPRKPPGSRLVLWSRDVGSALPPRPAHLPFPERIWSLLKGSSPPSRFPRRYSTPVLVSWPWIRTVWLVDSFGSAPPTTSDIPLAGHRTPGLLTVIVSSLTSTDWVHPGRETARAGRGEQSMIYQITTDSVLKGEDIISGCGKERRILIGPW